MPAVTEKRELPIAARLKGPGPAQYGLPSTVGFLRFDKTKTASPAYSIMPKRDINPKSHSPGPVHGVQGYQTYKGRNLTPAYSMTPKREDQVMRNFYNRSPAPGSYSPESYPMPGKPTPPSYSLKHRLDDRPNDLPAPNAYNIPDASTPAISMQGRAHLSKQGPASPGPGHYENPDQSKFKRSAPSYTLSGAHYPPDGRCSPPPNAYSPNHESVSQSIAPPAFTMGIKHTEYMMSGPKTQLPSEQGMA